MSLQKEYPDDERYINDLVVKNKHLYESNGLVDYANDGKSVAQNAIGIWKRVTSTKLGLAISIIVLIMLVMLCILIVMGFGTMLGNGNPIGIVKVVVMLALLVGVFYLL